MSRVVHKLGKAADRGDVAYIERQIAAGADPNTFVNDWTLLQLAAHEGHVPVIAALLKAGARVDDTNDYGETALILAVMGGHTGAIDALVAASADVRLSKNDGDTALHIASRNGRLDIARLLLEAGAEADVPDCYDKRPIDQVRAPPVCSLRLRTRVTPLRRRVSTRRCAYGRTRPTRPPCARC
jgi:ankyrin repeat protein